MSIWHNQEAHVLCAKCRHGDTKEAGRTSYNSGSMQYRWTLRNNFIIGGTAYVPRTVVGNKSATIYRGAI